MKKLISLLTIAFLTLFSLNLLAQHKKDASTVNKVFIDAKGGIYNHDGTKLGYIDKGDIVRNAKGQKVYFIDKEGNVVDANGKNLGKAQKNGSYYNLQGENVITVKDKNAEECEILDPSGHNLGTVHKNYKLHACAAHCLAIKEKKGQ